MNQPPASSISTSLSTPKPKRRTRGPAKVYEKSRSSQRLEDRKNPPPANNETTDSSDDHVPSDKDSDTEDDEAEVQNELEAESSELAQASVFLATGEDPESYEEAIASADRDEWLAAMDSEMESITSVGTFELVRAPRDRKPIGCKWVYRIKRTASGEISRYKARLVAQGFAQKPGVDFTETFAPVAKTDSIRLLLAFAAANNFEIHQVDVKSAFLNGKLEETIYMRQPKGFTAKGKEDWVWQLNQTLYGLRQSGRVWYKKLRDALLELGFKPSAADPCVFIRSHDGNLSIVFTHVDDLGIICNSVSVIVQLKGELAQYFPISDLGEVHHLLGIKITRDREKRTIALSQEQYILDLLRKFGFDNVNPVRTPLDTSIRLSKNMPTSKTAPSQHENRDFPYQSIVGSLMHAAVMTRPDIAHAVQQVAQFMSDPQPAHCTAVKRILRYLRGTASYQLTFGPSQDSRVTAYCDADFANNPDTRRSISGFAFIFNGGCFAWSSKKQTCVSLSTAEAEYISAVHAAKSATWLRTLLRELGLIDNDPIDLRIDNQSAIALIDLDNSVNERSKHIEVRYHTGDKTWCPDPVHHK